MSSETTSILGAIGKFFGMLLFGKIQEYYEKKKSLKSIKQELKSSKGKLKSLPNDSKTLQFLFKKTLKKLRRYQNDQKSL